MHTKIECVVPLLKVNLQELTIVRGVMTQGRYARRYLEWVTHFKVLYSVDCDTWTYLGGCQRKCHGKKLTNSTMICLKNA